MPKLTLLPEGRELNFAVGQSLHDIILGGGDHIENPCSGKGTCGKCRVRVVNGILPAPTDAEKRFLSDDELASGIRLACMVWPEGDLAVALTEKNRKGKVLAGGYIPQFEVSPDISKCRAFIKRSSLHNQLPYEEAVKEAFDLPDEWRADASVALAEGDVTGVFHGDSLIALEAGNTCGKIYGAAIDIGTTTMVVSLVDMCTGEILADASALNPQKKFGLDVLTRISYEMEHEDEGIADLRNTLTASINELLAEATQKSGIDIKNVYEICVAANCTMMHTLLGIDARPIGKAPYAPVFTASRTLKASDIGLKAGPGAVLYCLPGVSSFIGADIVAGAYVCELEKQRGKVLFIDIGTNGEIVLSDSGRLTSCSCAAGPALEGMNISSGMRAADGAIEDITIGETDVSFTTIGDAPAEGICGSGILAAISELLRRGIVRKQGAFIKTDTMSESDPMFSRILTEKGKRSFLILDGSRPISITQGDVRQVQLAKGAILSGFYALLNDAGIDIEDLDKVIVAGQFGAHLSEQHLIGVGILPEAVRGKVEYVGNTSRTGAYLALMSGGIKREMEALARQMGYVELSAVEGYERLFSNCLIFP